MENFMSRIANYLSFIAGRRTSKTGTTPPAAAPVSRLAATKASVSDAAVAVLQVIGCIALVPAAFWLKTVAEFLKAGGANIVCLVIQNPWAAFAITIVLVAAAVLVERKLERKTPSSDVRS
jgi:hypothetical protein